MGTLPGLKIPRPTTPCELITNTSPVSLLSGTEPTWNLPYGTVVPIPTFDTSKAPVFCVSSVTINEFSPEPICSLPSGTVVPIPTLIIPEASLEGSLSF